MLRAALLSGDVGKDAARDWLEGADFHRLGKATRGILPILYERLRKDGFEDPLMPTLKGVKRHTWYNNRRLFHHGGTAIRLLKQAGIDVMVIKGAAMVIDYYLDESLRPMEDLDILVRYADKKSAVRLLIENGWEMSSQNNLTAQYIKEGLYEIGKSVDLIHPIGIHLDLHWNLTHFCLGDNTDHDFWAKACDATFEGQLVKVLNPSDQLFHVLVHGAAWSSISPIRWIPDAVTILNRCPNFDWGRLIEQADQRSLSFMVRNALRNMDSYCRGLVPLNVMNNLDEINPRFFEYIEYWNLSKPGSRGLFRSIICISSDFLRYSRSDSLFKKIRLMPHYLRIRFGAKGLFHFINIAIVKVGRHL